MVIILTIFLIGFIVFSGLWERSSYSSMVGYTYGVYQKTDDWWGVNAQYDQMKASFDSGQDRYLYWIANMSVGVNKYMVPDQSKDTYIDTVLKIYTSDLYNLNGLPGVRGGINFVAGDTTHEIYAAVMVIFGLIALWIMRYMYLNAGLIDFLKQIGLSFLIAAIITFVLMSLVYTLFVNPWIGTKEDIYMQGLPIIASMIKEFYTYYIAAIGVIGVILMLPAVTELVGKGNKDKKEKAPGK